MDRHEDAHRTKPPQSREPQKRSALLTSMGRRHFLTKGASLIALGSSALLLPTGKAAHAEQDTDPMLVPGSPARTYGERSPFESAGRSAANSVSLTPLQHLHGIVTPSSLHFERHHYCVPAIDSARHRLLVHGLVDRPMVFSVDELLRFPSVSRLAFIECAGNSRDHWGRARDGTVQEIHGLTSTSE